MEDPAPQIRPVHAVLQPDGSIELDVSLPGWDEPETLTIPPARLLIWKIGMLPEEIDLDGTDSRARIVRDVVDRYIRQAQVDLTRRQEYARRRQAAAPAVSAYEQYAC